MMAGESVLSALLLCLTRPATAISCTAQLADLDCLPAFSHSPPDTTKAPTARLAPGQPPTRGLLRKLVKIFSYHLY